MMNRLNRLPILVLFLLAPLLCANNTEKKIPNAKDWQKIHGLTLWSQALIKTAQEAEEPVFLSGFEASSPYWQSCWKNEDIMFLTYASSCQELSLYDNLIFSALLKKQSLFENESGLSVTKIEVDRQKKKVNQLKETLTNIPKDEKLNNQEHEKFNVAQKELKALENKLQEAKDELIEKKRKLQNDFNTFINRKPHATHLKNIFTKILYPETSQNISIPHVKEIDIIAQIDISIEELKKDNVDLKNLVRVYDALKSLEEKHIGVTNKIFLVDFLIRKKLASEFTKESQENFQNSLKVVEHIVNKEYDNNVWKPKPSFLKHLDSSSDDSTQKFSYQDQHIEIESNYLILPPQPERELVENKTEIPVVIGEPKNSPAGNLVNEKKHVDKGVSFSTLAFSIVGVSLLWVATLAYISLRKSQKDQLPPKEDIGHKAEKSKPETETLVSDKHEKREKDFKPTSNANPRILKGKTVKTTRAKRKDNQSETSKTEEMSMVHKENTQLKEERDKFKKEVGNLKHNNELLKQNLQKKSAPLQVSKSYKTDKENRDLQMELNEYKSSLKKWEIAYYRLEKDKGDIEAKFEQKEKDLEKEKLSYQTQKKSDDKKWSTQIIELKSEKNDANTALQNARTMNITRLDSINALKNEKNTLAEDLAEKKVSFEKTTKLHKKSQEENEQLKATITTYTNDLEKLQKQKKQLEDRNQAASLQLQRFVPPSYSRDGELHFWHDFLATHVDIHPAETCMLEARLHLYAAALKAYNVSSERKDERAIKSAREQIVLATHGTGEALFLYLKAMGYGAEAIQDQAKAVVDALNKELESQGCDIKLRLPGLNQLANANWMSFEGGRRIEEVDNWGVFYGKEVKRLAYVHVI